MLEASLPLTIAAGTLAGAGVGAGRGVGKAIAEGEAIAVGGDPGVGVPGTSLSGRFKAPGLAQAIAASPIRDSVLSL